MSTESDFESEHIAEHEYVDALPSGVQRGRGAGLNPGNRFESVRLSVLGDYLDQQLHEQELGRPATTQVLADKTRTIINYVDPEKSPDIGFRWSINPYRGCEHGCIYCYARPTHEMLGMSCGMDFESRILAKLDAPRLLRKELAHPKWRGETIMMSGVTDCYQPVEARLKLTRQCLQIMAQCHQPVSIVTKNRLIVRDLDLLKELVPYNAVHAAISLTTLDNKLAAAMEPRASSPRERLDAIAQLSSAGVPVSVMVAPLIPGLTDHELPQLLDAAAKAGATGAGYVLLRLPHQIKALFIDWLHRTVPQRAARVESLIRQTRDGNLYDATSGVRMRGEGELAQQMQKMFRVFRRKYNLHQPQPPLNSEHFFSPPKSGQGLLF